MDGLVSLHDTISFTHICSPHLSKFLTLYGVTVLIIFYPTILSSTQIISLVLQILLLRVMQIVNHTFLFRIVPLVIPSSHTNQCISKCITLHHIPVKYRWEYVYQAMSNTKVLMDRLSISTPLNEKIILKLPTTYCTTIFRDLLESLEGRLVYYEPLFIITRHICRIFFPTSLRHITFNPTNVTHIARYMRKYEILHRIRLRFFRA